MIPKIIHYCWFGGKPKPDDVNVYIASWRKYCPDYEIQEWNETNFNVNENDYCREAYEARKWAFVTDYVRLKVLYEYGGFYMDTDVEVVKSLDPLRFFEAVSGYESKTHIQTGIIGACRGNEWIEMLLKNYEYRHFIKRDGSFDQTTNVKIISKLTREKYNILLDGEKKIFGQNMIILPFDYLCAKDYKSGKIQQSSNTYTIHHFNGSWLSEEDIYANELGRKLQHILPFFIAHHVAKCYAIYKYHGVIVAMQDTVVWIKSKTL